MYVYVHDVEFFVSTHSRLKAAGGGFADCRQPQEVSTHSRLKAAGFRILYSLFKFRGFNTQPPEGGWRRRIRISTAPISFNTQPPEGGWVCACYNLQHISVSTHSRLKAAGYVISFPSALFKVSTHSRLKAAGCSSSVIVILGLVSTHSRLKAAGTTCSAALKSVSFGFNTQPPEGGWYSFQRPALCIRGFNTQPPEGGWGCWEKVVLYHLSFNTQPPEGGWRDSLQ